MKSKTLQLLALSALSLASATSAVAGPGVVLQGFKMNGPGLVLQGVQFNGPGIVVQGTQLAGAIAIDPRDCSAPAVLGHSPLSGLAAAQVKVRLARH